MIAHAGDNAALTDSLKPAFSLTDSQRSGYLDSADTETPNVKPDVVDSKASPVKPGEFTQCTMPYALKPSSMLTYVLYRRGHCSQLQSGTCQARLE